MTPNAIEILIHCHVSREPHPRRNAPAVEEELKSLRINGLIFLVAPDCYQTTDRGRAHVEQLCGIAWPTSCWIGADGRVINID